MDQLLLYHHNNNTFNTLCRLCFDKSGTTYIFQDYSLPDKIQAITGIKVNNLSPYPNKLCDNCCGIIQLTLDFQESVIKNDKMLNDFVKTYYPSERLPTSNEPVSLKAVNIREDRSTRKEMNTDPQAKLPPTLRIRKDLFQNQIVNKKKCEAINNTDDYQLLGGTEPVLAEIQNCDHNDTSRNNQRTSTSSMETIVLDSDEVARQNCESPIDGITNKLYIDEQANESQVNVNDSNFIQDKDRQTKTKNDNCESNITCDVKVQNIADKNNICVKEKKSKKHKHNKIEKFQNREIKKEPPEEQLDIKTSKRIKYEDDVNYNCDQCSKFFVSAKKLYCHMRIHNKKYECEVAGCKKAFATKGDLQRHTRTHTGERPYVCNLCDKKFTQRILLRHHKDTIHGCNANEED